MDTVGEDLRALDNRFRLGTRKQRRLPDALFVVSGKQTGYRSNRNIFRSRELLA
jgi:hypothetical protein